MAEMYTICPTGWVAKRLVFSYLLSLAEVWWAKIAPGEQGGSATHGEKGTIYPQGSRGVW